MLRIKLSRRGKKKQPTYRLVVMEKAKDPWGDFLENVGAYNPRAQEDKLSLKEDRVKHWLSVGAQPTPTVHNLLVDAGLIDAKKVRGSALGKKAKEAIKEAEKKAKEEAEAAKAKAEEEKAAASEGTEEAASKEASAEDAQTEEAPVEEAPAEEASQEEPQEDDKKE